MSDDLRTLRKQLGLSQAQLAAVLGTRQASISENEHGKPPPRPERILAVRYLLEHPEALIPGQDVLAVPPRIITDQSA